MIVQLGAESAVSPTTLAPPPQPNRAAETALGLVALAAPFAIAAYTSKKTKSVVWGTAAGVGTAAVGVLLFWRI